MDIGKVIEILFISNLTSLSLSLLLVIFTLITRNTLKVGSNFNYTFSLFIFLSDLGIHSLNLINHYKLLNCKVISNLINFLELLILSITLFTAYNLYAVILDKKSKLFRSHWSYLIICLILSSLLFIPSTISNWNICNIDYLKHYQVWITFTIFDGIWYLLVISSSSIIFVLCLVNIYKTDLEYFYSTKLYWSIFNRLLISLVFIPMVSSLYFLTYLLIPLIGNISGESSKEIRLIAENVPISFQAILHFILFLLDPNFHQAFKEIMNRSSNSNRKSENKKSIGIVQLSHKVEWNDNNLIETKFELESQILGVSLDELKYIL